MTLQTDLEQFVHDHRPHSGMTSDATTLASNGCRLTVACAWTWCSSDGSRRRWPKGTSST
jgi:hypothetical protein